MGALERLAEAQISSNLADDPMRLSDVDYLRASGWAAQTCPEGLMLYRLKYANDHREWKQTVQRMYALIVGKAYRTRLTITAGQMRELADSTLRYWIAPICPVCLGRGANVVPGTPNLSDEPCGYCHGTGRVSVKKAVKEHVELAEWLLGKMDGKVGAFVSAAKNATC